MRTDRSLRWIASITPEKVDQARRELGLGETATRAQVVNRFRDLARRWHPDVSRNAEPVAAHDRFRRISQAKTLLMQLIRIYRYSFRPADTRRDQENRQIRHIRQFGGGLYGDPIEAERSVQEFIRRHPRVIATETIVAAARRLELPDTATWKEIEHAHRRLAKANHPDRLSPARHRPAAACFQEIQAAFQLLRDFTANYRYSFRPGDIRRDQFDPLEHHRRQFANDPVWAGGEYDDPSER
jgi:curved DNA-binding protein CbpA